MGLPTFNPVSATAAKAASTSKGSHAGAIHLYEPWGADAGAPRTEHMSLILAEYQEALCFVRLPLGLIHQPSNSAVVYGRAVHGTAQPKPVSATAAEATGLRLRVAVRT